MVPHEKYRLTLTRETVDERGTYRMIGEPETVGVNVIDLDGASLGADIKRRALERLLHDMTIRVREIEESL